MPFLPCLSNPRISIGFPGPFLQVFFWIVRNLKKQSRLLGTTQFGHIFEQFRTFLLFRLKILDIISYSCRHLLFVRHLISKALKIISVTALTCSMAQVIDYLQKIFWFKARNNPNPVNAVVSMQINNIIQILPFLLNTAIDNTINARMIENTKDVNIFQGQMPVQFSKPGLNRPKKVRINVDRVNDVVI